MGCTQQEARRCLVVLHGLGSSRLAAMPGVTEEMLMKFGVRLVAFDRAGYGQSEPDPSMTLEGACEDLEQVLDMLQLGPKVFLLGFSCGGAYCYAAARFIPHRIAGIALWCPIGCFQWKGISQEARDSMCRTLSQGSRALLRYGGQLPFFILRWYVSFLLARRAGEAWVRHCQKTLCPPDQRHLQLHEASNLMLRDNVESLTAYEGYGMATDLHLVSNHWGFELEDIAEVFDGLIHIWQGDSDNLVPFQMQRIVKSQLPKIVNLHELKGEGHLSWFCFNHAAHRETLATLFGEVES
ncbi:hypothetical protein GOP47_0007268 [Adiantum capillus-veneris]|uniref:AB hydrolase-1 domain-containing protein n=1 Tax=Adiantum capillus-veneris TaxID=13818 RepID=A0A9D4V0K7_ADICA|nr:hypothetical protein GOP47_0007268 [Adiantum capillus-veneris]